MRMRCGSERWVEAECRGSGPVAHVRCRDVAGRGEAARDGWRCSWHEVT